MNCSTPNCRPCAAPPPDFTRPGWRPDWYRRVHAWALSRGNARYEAAVETAKRALLSPLRGTVLEIGPGTGSNLRFFSGQAEWIGVEPNPHSRAHLMAAAASFWRSVRLLDGVAERLPLPDASVDAVVSSLVLCSVSDPQLALAEIRRVLRPGGRFVFIEHVAAEERSWLRSLQRIMRGPQALLGDGCRPDRDTLDEINAAGFAWVFHCRDRMPVPLVSPHILGYALR